MYSTDIYTEPNIPNQHGTRPNICNRCWSRANYPFLLTQISAPTPQPISTNVGPNKISTTDVGYPLISIRSRAPFSSDAKAPPYFSNRCHSRSNYLPPTPRLPEIFSTDARDFKPSVADPLRPYEVLTPSLPPTRSSEALTI